jgi:2-polyprenyl-3-methyl-5-hydroxy-6-metoxy-1,4-benzoquinol methylase
MYNTVTKCRACNGTDLIEILDLGTQPPANSFVTADTVAPVFPLNLLLCRTCFLGQLGVVVDPTFLYKHYIYTMGTTNTIREYVTKFAEWCDNITTKSTGNVLDIACNTGEQLDAFKELGWTTYGVDPAENLTPIAREKGHAVVTNFWGVEAIRALPANTKFDVITAQNVFAHVDDIHGFLNACQLVMHEKSVLYIQTSQSEMFVRNEFDTIYHEHLSFFNTLAMYNAASRAGMVLENVFKTSIHGSSYIFCLSLNGGVHPSSNTEGVLEFERATGLYLIDTYYDFAKRAKKVTTDLAQFVEMVRASGKKVIGFGAAAKGMTVLNYGKITLDYIVDENPLKQNLFASAQRIPVYAPEVLYNEPTEVVIVPLAWNFYDEIIDKVSINRNFSDSFISYFPHFRVLTTQDYHA